MDKVTFTRKELYDLVWSESMSALARRYNISDVGLRKICKRMNVPAPKGGYWEKLKWGKPVTIDALAEDSTVEQSVSLLQKDIEIATISPLRIRQKEIEQDPNVALTVPARLTNPDKLITNIREYFNDKPYKDYNSGLLGVRTDHLDIQVSPEFVGRALRFMDTLIKAFKVRGHRVYVNYRKTYVDVYGEDYQIAFKEKTTRVLVTEGYRHTVLKATGKLIFKAQINFSDRYWEDKKVKLEDQISSIIAKLEVDGAQKKVEREEYRKVREERERKEQVEREIQQRKEKEIADFKELIAEAQTWQKISLLRSYLDEIETEANRKGLGSKALTKWLESTRKKASLYDPIEERIREVLSLEK